MERPARIIRRAVKVRLRQDFSVQLSFLNNNSATSTDCDFFENSWKYLTKHPMPTDCNALSSCSSFILFRFPETHYHPHQVSMHGRFLAVRGSGGGHARSPSTIQRRVSAGSMTSSISNTVAVLSAFPCSYMSATISS